MSLRHACCRAALVLLAAAGPRLLPAQTLPPEIHGPPPPLHGPPAAPEPEPMPRAILVRELNRILAGRPPELAGWPLVERLRQALARTDLAFDLLAGGQPARIVGFRIDREQGFEARRRSLAATLLLERPGRPFHLRALVFEFDAGQGEWQVSDIRDDAGNSLRKQVQLSPPRAIPP